MKKLKTLKDIVKEYKGKDRIDFDFTLRAEAVKWIEFQKEIQLYNPNYAIEYRLNIEWIKHFFNITEENLK